MKQHLCFLFFLVVFHSCKKDDVTIKKDVQNKTSSKKIIKKSKVEVVFKVEDTLKMTSIFGYRFSLIGDFNGDKIKDTLFEKVTSSETNKEINKYYEEIGYDDLVEVTIKKNPSVSLVSNSSKIKTFDLGVSGQIFGFSFLKNEGDLNGDGTDEVSYVADYADFSSLNRMVIITYKNHKWEELYEFPIWDWLLPQTPISNNRYGLFGVENKDYIKNKKINDSLVLAFKEFPGLIKKIKKRKIQVKYRTDEADLDSMIVKLKR